MCVLCACCSLQLLTKRAAKLESREELSAKLRDIGTVPAEVEEYKRDRSSKQVRAAVACCRTVSAAVSVVAASCARMRRVCVGCLGV